MSDRASSSSMATIGTGASATGERLKRNHLEPDALAETRHLAADTAEANQPQRLALQLHALHDAASRRRA